MRLTPDEERLLLYLGRKRLSMSEIEKEHSFATLRPSRRTLQRLLTELVRRGYVLQTGNRRGTRYEKTEV